MVRKDGANKKQLPTAQGKDIGTVCAGSKRIILNMTGVTDIDGSCTGELVAVSTTSLT
jgi:anti-anti-sigma regulatory factor